MLIRFTPAMDEDLELWLDPWCVSVVRQERRQTVRGEVIDTVIVTEADDGEGFRVQESDAAEQINRARQASLVTEESA